MPQPFVDNDDSSVRKPGDICVGGAANGTCGGPNHQWDGNNAVWVENRILYGGSPLVSNGDAGLTTMEGLSIWEPTGLDVMVGPPWEGQVLWPDINLNTPPGATTMVTNYNVTQQFAVCPSGPGCGAAPTTTYFSAGGPGGGPGDTLGMNFTRLGLPNSGNPLCDAGYFIADGGAQVSNPYCTYDTVISGFSGGFLGSYQVLDMSGCCGEVGIIATAQSSLDSHADDITMSGPCQ
jgi:hypothetical protein